LFRSSTILVLPATAASLLNIIAVIELLYYLPIEYQLYLLQVAVAIVVSVECRPTRLLQEQATKTTPGRTTRTMKKRGPSLPVRRATAGVSFAPIVEVKCHETDTVSYSGIDAEMAMSPLSEQPAEMPDNSWQSLGGSSSSIRRGSRRSESRAVGLSPFVTVMGEDSPLATRTSSSDSPLFHPGEPPQQEQDPPLRTRRRPYRQDQLANLSSSWQITGSIPSSPTALVADSAAAAAAATTTGRQDASESPTIPEVHQREDQEPTAQSPRQTRQEQLALLNSSWHSTGSVTSSRTTPRLVAMSPFVTVMGENNNAMYNTSQDETDQTSTPPSTALQTPKPTPQPSKYEQLALLNSSWHTTGSVTPSRSTPRVVAMSPFVTVMGDRNNVFNLDNHVDHAGDFLVDTGDLDYQRRGDTPSPTYPHEVSPIRGTQGGQEDIAASVTRTRAGIPSATPGLLDQHLVMEDDDSSEDDCDDL
jgi:hypothetical protein